MHHFCPTSCSETSDNPSCIDSSLIHKQLLSYFSYHCGTVRLHVKMCSSICVSCGNTNYMLYLTKLLLTSIWFTLFHYNCTVDAQTWNVWYLLQCFRIPTGFLCLAIINIVFVCYYFWCLPIWFKVQHPEKGTLHSINFA